MRISVSSLSRVGTRAETTLNFVGSYAILAMTLLTTVDVVLRYLFRMPIPGTYEIMERLIVFVAFLGLAYTQARGGHIKADTLLSRLRARTRVAFEAIGLLLSLGIMALLTWKGGSALLLSVQTNDYEVTAYFNLVYWPARAALFVGCLALTMRLSVDFVRHIGMLALPIPRGDASHES